MDYFVENLNFLFRKTGLSPYTLARRIGIDPTTAYRWLNKNCRPHAQARHKIEELFNISFDTLMYKKLDEGTLVKINSDYAAPVDTKLPESSSTRHIENWARLAPMPDLNTKGLLITSAVDDAMLPEIKNGDLVYIDARPGITRNNDIVLGIPQQENGSNPSPVIRRLFCSDNSPDTYLVSDNPSWSETRFIKAETVIGKVVAIFRKI